MPRVQLSRLVARRTNDADADDSVEPVVIWVSAARDVFLLVFVFLPFPFFSFSVFSFYSMLHVEVR